MSRRQHRYRRMEILRGIEILRGLSKLDYTPTLLIVLNILILKLIQNKDLVFFIFFYYSVCGLNNSREYLKMQNNTGTILIT